VVTCSTWVAVRAAGAIVLESASKGSITNIIGAWISIVAGHGVAHALAVDAGVLV